MRFLIDQNRSPRLAELLREAGHDAVHTAALGLEKAEDDVLLALADQQQRIVITGDTDFGALLALTHSRSPSVILFRARYLSGASDQSSVILEHLDELSEELVEGAVIVVTDDHIRVRRLPCSATADRARRRSAHGDVSRVNCPRPPAGEPAAR